MDKEAEVFHSLFTSIKGVEFVKWDNKDNVGISVLKPYPNNTSFVPVKSQNGQIDSVCLIRIGYYHKDKTFSKYTKAPLHLTISKVSRYILKHHWYNYSDDNSPTEEAVKISESSRRPADLVESDRFEYYIEKNKIYDKKLHIYINPHDLIKNFFRQHLRTLTNIPFILKVASQRFIIRVIDPVKLFLIKINLVCFGKKFKENTEFLVGILKPYNANDLEDLSITSDKPKILGSDFPITYQSATVFIVFILIIFISNYYYKIDLLGMVALFNKANDNSLFLGSLIAALIIFFDRVIPNFIVRVINLLIRLKSYLTFLRIGISD